MEEIEYYSKLATDLLTTDDEGKIVELVADIEKTKSPYFLYPVYKSYIKNREKSISHYLMGALGEIDSPSLKKILMDLVQESFIGKYDLLIFVQICADKKFFDEPFLSVAMDGFNLVYSGESNASYDLEDLTVYIKSSGDSEKILEIQEKCYHIFADTNRTENIRKVSLETWLEINPNEHFAYLVDNYEDLKEIDGANKLIAKTISEWRGPIVEKLSKLIIDNGGEGKVLLEIAEKKKSQKKQKESEKKARKREAQYPNVKIVYEIIDLRRKINNHVFNVNFGFKLFSESETLMLQSKIVSDRPNFTQSCIDMRDLLPDINKKVQQHGYTIDEIEKLLPHVNEVDYNKSLNSLYLYLKKKQVDIDFELCGLRTLLAVYNKVAHPKGSQGEIRAILSSVDLVDYYDHEDYSKLHFELLSLYRDSLSKLYTQLKSTT